MLLVFRKNQIVKHHIHIGILFSLSQLGMHTWLSMSQGCQERTQTLTWRHHGPGKNRRIIALSKSCLHGYFRDLLENIQLTKCYNWGCHSDLLEYHVGISSRWEMHHADMQFRII